MTLQQLFTLLEIRLGRKDDVGDGGEFAFHCGVLAAQGLVSVSGPRDRPYKVALSAEGRNAMDTLEVLLRRMPPLTDNPLST